MVLKQKKSRRPPIRKTSDRDKGREKKNVLKSRPRREREVHTSHKKLTKVRKYSRLETRSPKKERKSKRKKKGGEYKIGLR
jgi:hypothetical protein